MTDKFEHLEHLDPDDALEILEQLIEDIDDLVWRTKLYKKGKLDFTFVSGAVKNLETTIEYWATNGGSHDTKRPRNLKTMVGQKHKSP